jgi:hypothetical protein
MSMLPDLPWALADLLLWGLLATVVMTTVLQGAQGLGLSRLNLPFLAGTFFAGDRRRAVVLGIGVRWPDGTPAA